MRHIFDAIWLFCLIYFSSNASQTALKRTPFPCNFRCRLLSKPFHSFWCESHRLRFVIQITHHWYCKYHFNCCANSVEAICGLRIHFSSETEVSKRNGYSWIIDAPKWTKNTKLFNIYANFFKANELLSESLCRSKHRLVLTPSARCERKLVVLLIDRLMSPQIHKLTRLRRNSISWDELSKLQCGHFCDKRRELANLRCDGGKMKLETFTTWS